MQIRFADSRPEGTYSLVLPVAGPDRSGLASLGPARAQTEAALRAARFEGEAGAVFESWIAEGDGVRRLLRQRLRAA